MAYNLRYTRGLYSIRVFRVNVWTATVDYNPDSRMTERKISYWLFSEKGNLQTRLNVNYVLAADMINISVSAMCRDRLWRPADSGLLFYLCFYLCFCLCFTCVLLVFLLASWCVALGVYLSGSIITMWLLFELDIFRTNRSAKTFRLSTLWTNSM